MSAPGFGRIVDVVALAVGFGALVLLVGSLLTGCGGPPAEARRILLTTAEAVHAVDEVEAGAYTSAAARALSASSTAAEYRDAMSTHDTFETALRTARSALVTVEAAFDTWEAGGASRWLPAVGCLAVALVSLAEAMAAAGLGIPSELTEAMAMAESVGAGLCGSGS